MGLGARPGFSLVEVLLALAVLGSALGGLASLVTAALAQEGEAARRMTARHLAAAALEPGPPPNCPPPFRLRIETHGGSREARVQWPEARGPRTFSLRVWTGDD